MLKGKWLSYSLTETVPVLYMACKITYSRVKNVTKRVFP